MSLLAPLFLIGGLAIAAPIIFHLIRRTIKERRPFSSLMFLQPTPPRVTRRSKLENILLLLLRCAVLGLLALGFARPFLPKALPFGAGGRVPNRIVVLVDTSASMRRQGLWPEAQARLESVLRQAGPEDRVAVFAFDRQVRQAMGFEQWTGAAAGDRVPLALRQMSALSPTWADTHLGNALVAAAEAFATDSKQDQGEGARRVILISDVQAGARLDGLQGYEWPKGIELVLEAVAAKRLSNAGLQIVTDRDESDGASNDPPVRVRVANSADAKREQFHVTWAGGAEDIYVPPGQSRVVTIAKAPAGTERLVLTGDDEDFDNTAYLVPPRAERVKVLFVGQDGERDSTQLLYYLRRAFQQTRRQLVDIVARAPEAPMTAADVANCTFMILTDPVPDNRVETAAQFLKDGKTVLFALKTPAGAASIARLASLPGLTAEEAKADRYSLLGQIDFQHPLFLPFADPRFSDFTKIHFWKHRKLPADLPANARVLARFDGGDPALVQFAAGKGTLLVLTAGWQPTDSQLALSSKFVPLLYSMLEVSGGIRARLAQYAVGDRIPLPREAVAPEQKTTVKKPDGSQVELPAGETMFAATDQPGIYTLASTPPFRFAVNLGPEESRTTPLNIEELERLGVPLKFEGVRSVKDQEKRREQLRAAELENRQKLWRWLLVAALVIVLIETWLSGWTMRRGNPAAAAA